VEELAADPVVSAALDAAGAGVSRYFGEIKREEFFEWHGTVGQWELDRYLTAF
jgi:glutamine synthetase